MLSRQYPLVFFAEQFIGQSLRVLAEARSNLIRFDGSSMFDRDWVSIFLIHGQVLVTSPSLVGQIQYER